ncbi:MAG TPA: class I SAM-dependent methyltransferase [Actinomycetota bacterium]|nr:class I SAM-dependent methyltransferase [Actinomycetota bacterium]
MPLPSEGETAVVKDRKFVMVKGILREETKLSPDGTNIASVFGFKWAQHSTFDSEATNAHARAWLEQKYGDVRSAAWWNEYPPAPLVLDAGCGAAVSAVELFGDRLKEVRYLGVDVSDAVETAAGRLATRGLPGQFLQVDLAGIPIDPESVDVIFSEGVLHHTQSTEKSLKALSRLLKPGGRFLFYVYRKKAPIREFTDDYIRERLADRSPQEAWEAMIPLTYLGKALAELDVEIDIPLDIELLDIPAGRINVQRLFYWYFCKAFHHPDLSVEEMNHINYDWYAPRFAHRHTAEELNRWCAEAGLEVERQYLEPAGITMVTRKL